MNRMSKGLIASHPTLNDLRNTSAPSCQATSQHYDAVFNCKRTQKIKKLEKGDKQDRSATDSLTVYLFSSSIFGLALFIYRSSYSSSLCQTMLKDDAGLYNSQNELIELSAVSCPKCEFFLF